MPPDLPNEQELNLKKRARRRLVGAVALVLLMVIVLPRILQDRAALAPQEAIKITMPTMAGEKQVAAFSDSVAETKVSANQEHDLVASKLPEATGSTKTESNHDLGLNENSVSDKKIENEKKVEVKSKDVKPSEPKIYEPKLVEPKVNEAKLVETKVNKQKSSEIKMLETKAASKNSDSFSVQVGVYSDANNVKQLQSKLKEIGYVSHTEKVATPKGEKIRLKAGNFATRQDAIQAQAKIQKIGLSGMIVSNE
ncbi:cell division protein DedD [mine drainage metagenome]|uniref:Cell division protein DedD n=1 Tax=mine drainage metagenome TaxID=410659 RepID=A0A1J5TFE4_9ZZZZ